MAPIQYRNRAGQACSAEEYAAIQAEDAKAATEAAAAEQLDSLKGSMSEEEIAAVPQSVWEKIQAGMSHMLSGPVVGTLYDVNKDAAILATRLRVGRLLNNKVRGTVLRNVLPSSVHPLMLDNPLGAALTDLGYSNLVMALVVMFGDKLPGNMGKLLMVLARCTTTAAYLDGAGSIRIEELIDQFISSDMLKILGEAEAAGA